MKHSTATLIAGAVAAPALMVTGAAVAKTTDTAKAAETTRAGCSSTNDQSRSGLKLKALSPSANYVARQSCSHSAQA